MHAIEEGAKGFRGAEEVIKDGAVPAELLVPTRSSLADCVGQVLPERVEDIVGVEHVADEGFRAVGSQVNL